jgi:hypothetical protein
MLSFLGFGSTAKPDKPETQQHRKSKKSQSRDRVKDLIDDAFKVDVDEAPSR